MSAHTVNLITELQAYGVSRQGIRLFDGSIEPEHQLNYLDLIEPRKKADLTPAGVAESQGLPLLYFVNESRLALTAETHNKQLQKLRRNLACRGDRAYLAIIRPGELQVVPVSLNEQEPNWKQYKAGSDEALTFFSRLALGYYDGEGDTTDADYVFKEMFSLLKHVGRQLVEQGIESGDVISLTGRALFFRFLLDRDVIIGSSFKVPETDDLQACFDDADKAFHTSKWLDQTFNGDFLPLLDGGSQQYFTQLAPIVFKHLAAIVRGEQPVGSDAYQTKLRFKKWGDFDFAHVPVGLLSQVYEAFCWEWEPDNSKSTSVHYTPRNIAAVLIDEAFDGIDDAHECRVLDPACGAAVFLVLAFRRLYREHWQSTGIRPNTQVIRAILENQLVGFDISDSALRLAALSLYLTAIELDPKPVPPEKLRFTSLKDKVLFNHRRPGIDPDSGPVIGSLGEHVGDRFDGQFDIVLSNPPWTSLKELKDTERKCELTAAFTNISKAIIQRKGKVDLSESYQNPDSTPDMPFLWKSTEWCKPGGRIAMALPTRILFKLQDIPCLAREIVFRIIEVNGIINGSNLTDTKVWPNMRQPFMLLFARNQTPRQGHHLQFITPYCDTKLNSKGELRIDSKSAKPIEVETTFKQPWLWKALAIGTSLDVDVVQRINAANGRPLKTYWEKDLELVSRNGYQIKKNQKQRDASFMYGLPDLNDTTKCRFIVRYEELQPFTRATACWPREIEAYQAPLVLVLESPGKTRANGWALLAFEDVAFNESFYGYSAAKHPQGKTLVRYVHLFIHSHIWMHYALMITPQFGAERRTVDKAVVDECPIIPFESLGDTQRQQIEVLSERLINSTKQDSEVFDEIDLFFANLYGLDGLDLEVIRDTLEVCLPYNESRKRACSIPNGAEQEIFRQRVESVLRPFFSIVGEEPEITLWKPRNNSRQNQSPFGMILITKRGQSIEKPDEIFHQLILRLADDTGATRIIHTVEGGLVIGILNQYRYWTLSRARLLGAEIVRQHLSVFED